MRKVKYERGMKMKQKRNRWIGLLLTVMMLISMTMPAMAEDNGSITITNAVAGQIYSAYKIFDLESYAGTNYSYRIVEAWNSFDWKSYGITVDDDGYVTNVDSANIDKARLAKDALAYATTNTIGAAKTATADANGAEISGLDLGYYLVDSSLGALCGLSTTAPNAEIAEKNSKSSIAKLVKEDSTGSYGASATADMGQEVEFQLTVNVGTEQIPGLGTGIDADFVITDRLPAGISYVADSAAVVGGTSEWTATDFTAEYAENVLTITLKKEKLADLEAGTEIVITYEAKVDTDAAVGGTGNTNMAVLAYHGYTTEETGATVYTYDLSVFKFSTVSGDTRTALADAVFELKNSEGSALTFTAGENNVYTYDAGTAGEVTEITTDSTGKFTIQGLDAGTYYLSEKTAPAGYNKLTEDVTVTIAEDGTVTYKLKESGEVAAADANDDVLVENKTGSILPSTGGMGTTIFYLAGAILVIVAGVLLITKKRMSSEEK